MVKEGATRKLAAILAADVVGFSRLVGVDEEGTLARLRSYRTALIDPTIEKHHGRIVNTAGDGILAAFHSVVDAVRAALELQTALNARNDTTPDERRMDLRIGINMGDVVEQDNDLLGDGVNIAARLEGLAEPGGICLSRAARDQVRDRLDVTLEDMGEIGVKNTARPVRVFRIPIDKQLTKTPLERQSPTGGNDVEQSLRDWEAVARPLTEHVQWWSYIYGYILGRWPADSMALRGDMIKMMATTKWFDDGINRGARSVPLGFDGNTDFSAQTTSAAADIQDFEATLVKEALQTIVGRQIASRLL